MTVCARVIRGATCDLDDYHHLLSSLTSITITDDQSNYV